MYTCAYVGKPGSKTQSVSLIRVLVLIANGSRDSTIVKRQMRVLSDFKLVNYYSNNDKISHYSGPTSPNFSKLCAEILIAAWQFSGPWWLWR